MVAKLKFRKLANRLSFIIIVLYQRFRILFYFFLSNNSIKKSKIRIRQPILITGIGCLRVGKNSTVGFFPSPFFLSGYGYFDLRQEESAIEIGDDVMINNNATLIADGAKITIGNRTIIGYNLSIYTSDFHNLQPDRRIGNSYECHDVLINENVFIGSNVTILKGSVIGKNSVIANGSIVTGKIPENVIAGGIPCKVIKNI